MDKKCINNIYELAQKNNIKISEIEKETGVSTGYLSRLLKQNNAVSPSIDFIIKVSNLFKVTVDSLLFDDNLTSNKKDEKLISFLTSLCINTTNNKLEWEFDIPNKYSSNIMLYEPDGYGGASHYSVNFKSSTYHLYNNVYFASIKDKHNYKLYLIKLSRESNYGTINEYELYMYKDNSNRIICYSDFSNPDLISKLICNLYTIIKNKTTRIDISQDVLDIISNYK